MSMENDESVVHGIITVRLYDVDGNVKHEETINNLITDAGDLYQATRIAAGVNSNGVSQPTLVTGMKLGTGTAAATKAGAGAALATYLTGSNRTFDATYPKVTNLGSGLGVNVEYKATWAAGTATSASINEVVIVNDAANNATSTDANTIARGVFGSTINKASGEALEVTWNHKQLGA
jgi:hypothetical protein